MEVELKPAKEVPQACSQALALTAIKHFFSSTPLSLTKPLTTKKIHCLPYLTNWNEDLLRLIEKAERLDALTTQTRSLRTRTD